jgi:predicted DNA-binding protein
MSASLTFRLSESHRKKLERRAASLGMTVSEYIRELLARALDDRPLGERISHITGSLRLGKVQSDAWAEDIRKQNWRE